MTKVVTPAEAGVQVSNLSFRKRVTNWIPAFAGMTARLFRAKRPFKLTKPGWIFILYTIGVGAGAINTGNNLLYLVFGVFLGLILASGFLSDLSLWSVHVDYTFPHAAEAGQPVSLFLTVANNKRWFPSVSALVSMEGFLRDSSVRLRCHVPFIAAESTEHTRLEWVPPMRGRYRLDHVRLSTRFPFSLLEKWWRLRLEDQAEDGFYVTPATHPLDFRLLPLRTLGDDRTSEQPERGDGSVLLGLHAFAPGDNPRRIHWKSSAKRVPAYTGDSSSWLVREMNKDEREEILFVCPDAARFSGWKEADMERFVSFLASALKAGRESGYLMRLVVAGRLVTDEAAFLAQWDPRKNIDSLLESCLGTSIGSARAAMKMVDVEEAYRVVHAG